jgi:hypothetical protein
MPEMEKKPENKCDCGHLESEHVVTHLTSGHAGVSLPRIFRGNCERCGGSCVVFKLTE